MERLVMKPKNTWPYGWVVIRTNKRGWVVQTYEASHLDDAQRYGEKLAKIHNLKLEIAQ